MNKIDLGSSDLTAESLSPTAQTVIGRLKKRIAKLEKQRDFFRQQCDHYGNVMRLHPYREIEYRSVMDRRKEADRVRGLEQRCKEQALLIAKLTPPDGA